MEERRFFLRVDDALQQFVWTNASTFHIGLRYDEASWEWRWVDGGQMTYTDWATDVVATVAKPAGKNCAVAMFGSGPSAQVGQQPHAKWHPVTCDGFLAPAVCEIRLDGGVHDASTSLPTSKGNGAGPNAACKDTSGWQCDALKAILCNAAQYVKHVAEN
ncbi:hypothetical protein AAVH_22221 [Aphelenchoides avenae]|nr:hypothetical protein AAVH_22221 [Aphelenchus avenae]